VFDSRQCKYFSSPQCPYRLWAHSPSNPTGTVNFFTSCILRKFHYRVHTSPSLILILKQTYPVFVLPSGSLLANSTLTHSKWFVSFIILAFPFCVGEKYCSCRKIFINLQIGTMNNITCISNYRQGSHWKSDLLITDKS
jgi:hypothetical protein